MATRPPLRWHRRLEAHVGLGVVLFVAGSLVAVQVATTRAVNTRSLERASSDLLAARSAFSRLADDRAEFAAAQAALVTALPVFRAHMTDTRLASDAATLETMVEGYRGDLKADFVIVTDRAGQWTAGPRWTPTFATPDLLRAVIVAALAGDPSRNILPIDDRVFLVVSEPARFAEEVLGTLTVGYALDDAIAKRLAGITHCDVNLVANGHLYASSLDPTNRTALQALVADETSLRDGVSPVLQSVGAGTYAVGAFPLTAGPQNPRAVRLVLLQDWRPTQLFVDDVRIRVLEAGAGIFAVALGGSLLFSRRMSRPLHDVASAAHDIAGGNWERQIPVRGSAEASVTAQAFNEMTMSLRHWYEQAKKRDDELRQAQKLEAIGRLAGGVAHDFNNLLTAIRGYSELLLEDLEADDARRVDAEEIIKAADRAAELTRQLLAFSRRQVVAPRVVALDRIVANTEHMLRRLIGEDIELVTDLAPATGRALVDPSQFEQVVLNLAVNARDAMPTGGTIQITLNNVEFGNASAPHRSLAAGAYAQLAVSDTGCGMPKEILSRIFEPFFTTKEEGRGTGLGLATVYGIVEQAGGAIDVESEIGRGTTFRVYLPHTSGPEEPARESLSPPTRAHEQPSETVLLVEDEPHVAALVASALKKTGYVVLQASNATQALEIVRAHATPIDLLLTDVVMPGMNGRQLADEVKLTRGETRVLYMSGYSDDAVLRHGVQTASVHFIQKPFSMNALGNKIRETLKTSTSV
jgi:signal transduction histidine kinase/CheY-like chemotaxis protein